MMIAGTLFKFLWILWPPMNFIFMTLPFDRPAMLLVHSNSNFYPSYQSYREFYEVANLVSTDTSNGDVIIPYKFPPSNNNAFIVVIVIYEQDGTISKEQIRDMKKDLKTRKHPPFSPCYWRLLKKPLAATYFYSDKTKSSIVNRDHFRFTIISYKLQSSSFICGKKWSTVPCSQNHKKCLQPICSL